MILSKSVKCYKLKISVNLRQVKEKEGQVEPSLEFVLEYIQKKTTTDLMIIQNLISKQ